MSTGRKAEVGEDVKPEFCHALRTADPLGEMPIVVSSMWRFTHTIQQLRAHFPNDIGRQIVGVTSDLLDDNASSGGAWAMAGGIPSKVGSRQREVLAWMREFAPAGAWLAIDDRPSYFADECPHLFTVPGLHENEGGGINGMVAEDLLVRLHAFLGCDLAPEHQKRTDRTPRRRP